MKRIRKFFFKKNQSQNVTRDLTPLCSYFVMLLTPEAVLPRTGHLADVCAAVSGAAAAPSHADTQSGPTLDIFSGGFAEDSAGGRRQGGTTTAAKVGRPRAEWRTGTRCRFLRRFGPNWPSWSWSCPRVSSCSGRPNSAPLAGLRCCCCCCTVCVCVRVRAGACLLDARTGCN